MSVRQYSREQMEKLAENKDNIVMVEQESKDTRVQHKFRNEYLMEQVRVMRKQFEELLINCPKYTEVEMRTKVLNSKDGRSNSWMLLVAKYKFVTDVILKKFETKEDEKKYDVLLKCLNLEILKERGFIVTDKQVQDYWKDVGLSKEMNPIQHALDQIQATNK